MSSPAASRHVGERAVAIVAVKTQRGPLPLVPGPVHRVDQQDVLPAVGVVVEKRAARAQRFRKQFAAVRAAVVLEVKARLRRDVGEPEAERRRPPSRSHPRQSAATPTPRALRRNAWQGSPAASRQIHQAVPDRVDHQLRGLVNSQSVHDVRAMHGDGIRAQIQVPPQFPCSICRPRCAAGFPVRAPSTRVTLAFQCRQASPAADRAPFRLRPLA